MIRRLVCVLFGHQDRDVKCRPGSFDVPVRMVVVACRRCRRRAVRYRFDRPTFRSRA